KSRDSATEKPVKGSVHEETPKASNLKEQSESTVTQRTFIEVRLCSSSSSSSSSPSSVVSTPTVGSKGSLEDPVGVDSSPGSLTPSTKRTLSGAADLSRSTSTTHPSQEKTSCLPGSGETISATKNVSSDITCLVGQQHVHANDCQMDAKAGMDEKVKTSRSKSLHLRSERRSYSTETSVPPGPNPFSVQQRIKSFENLSGPDRPAIACIDVQSYAVTSKPPLSRRSSGHISTQGTESPSSMRNGPSCAGKGPETPTEPLHPRIPPSTVAFSNLDVPKGDSSRVPHPGEKAMGDSPEPEPDSTPQTSPVVRTRTPRSQSGLARSKLRELRALSMPDLDKLCTDQFTEDASEGRTKRDNDPSRVNRMYSSSSRRDGDQSDGAQPADASWSISLGELSLSPLHQNKLQNVLTSLTENTDVLRMIQEVKALTETTQVTEDIYFVVLSKDEGSGLGFSIAGGVDLEQKSISVHRVFSKGVAGVEGTIQRGDSIISINGTVLGGTTHGEALTCFHQARLHRQALVVIRKGKDSELSSPRQEVPFGAGRQAQCSSIITMETGAAVEVGPDGALSVELQKTSAGLGFSLEGGKASAQGDRPLNIKRIFRGGAAELSRVIDVGDEVLAINGRSLQGLMHYDAWNIIKAVSEGPVQLVIRKPRTSV
ncbi:hypothetical protein AGOR_G00013810, partial [Albula goreensis]